MEHIRQVELEPGNVVPVGHAEFGASSRYIGNIGSLPRRINIEFTVSDEGTDGDGCGCIVVRLASNKGDCELRMHVAFAKYLLSANRLCSMRSTSVDAKPDTVSLYTYSGENSQPRYILGIVLHENQDMLSCHARVEMKNIDVHIWDTGEVVLGTPTNQEDMDLRSDALISDLDYGTNLPEPGIPGRIFFLEVQDE